MYSYFFAEHRRRFRRIWFLLVAAGWLWAVQPIFGQDSANVDVSVNGFLKLDAYYDSRQVVSAREGEFLLYPRSTRRREASNGLLLDVNGRSNLNFTAFWSRLVFSLNGPSVMGARTEAVVDGDFMGTQNGFQNLFRLRHAFVQLAGEHASLLFGQYWSPLSVGPAVPQTVSFNVGAPMRPQAKFPQIRLTAEPFERLKVISAVTVQRDGFEEISGRFAQHRASIPGMHLHLRYETPQVLVGTGGYLRTIRPELMTDRIRSGAGTVYGQYTGSGWSARLQGVYGSDMADHIMLGGYVRTELEGRDRYRNLNTASLWSDITVEVSSVDIGLFGGYTRNLGFARPLDSGEAIIEPFARGPDIGSVWRVSPRITYQSGPVRLALEYEATTARYAEGWSSQLNRTSAAAENAVANNRILLSTFFFF